MDYRFRYSTPKPTDSKQSNILLRKNDQKSPTLGDKNENVYEKFFNIVVKHLVVTVAFSICALISFAQPKVQKPNECDCKVASYSPYNDWPLLALDDSVAICKPGTISFGSSERSLGYVDFLKRHSLSQADEKIIFCKAGRIVQNDYGEYSLTYQNKQLIITWNITIDSFMVDKNKWASDIFFRPIRPIYRQAVYASKNVLYLSPNKVVFHPHKISKQALLSVNDLYLSLKKGTSGSSVSTLLNRIFILAMSGDKLSQNRLMGFKKDIAEVDDKRLLQYQTMFKLSTH